jgi:hypothetical protein
MGRVRLLTCLLCMLGDVIIFHNRNVTLLDTLAAAMA